MANDVVAVQSWFKSMPNRLQRQLALDLQRIANNLQADIKAAAPVKSGALRDSVRVRRGRNTLEYFVEAGGSNTMGEIRTGSGVSYDYSLAVEFGTKKMEAQPFFYSTYREKRDAMREEIAQAVYEASGRL